MEETQSREQIRLRNESRQLVSQRDLGLQRKVGQDKNNLPVDTDNCGNRVAREHDIIYSTGLPMICWQQDMVTSHLADDDLKTLINSSPYFRELLKTQRISFLSESVFKIFSAWLLENIPLQNNYVNMNLKHLAPKEHLFNCRLVCKSWCSSFDKLFQNQIINGASALLQFIGPFTQSEGGVTKFFQHFQKTHPSSSSTRSPLITRHLEFRARGFQTENLVETWNRTISFLQSYGGHIWHLDLHFEYKKWGGLTLRKTYLNFRQVLMLTPNLKTLTFYYFDQDKDSLTYEPLIRNFPLPKLLSLQNLRIYGSPKQVFSHILRQNNHITKFSLMTLGNFNCNVKLDNLAEFQLITYLYELPLINAKWSVKKLVMNFIKDEFKWNRETFKIISDNWGENFEEMKLILLQHRGGKVNFDDCRFIFPKVKVLDLDMKRNHISVDVFLEMKSLEKITITTKHRHPLVTNVTRPWPVNVVGVKSRILMFNGYENKMYESNIWNLFPKLKYLEVDVIKYCRTEWIERNTK